MWGIEDKWVLAAYLLCIGSAALCVIYGLVNWNRGAEEPELPVTEEAHWAEEEKKLEEEL